MAWHGVWIYGAFSKASFMYVSPSLHISHHTTRHFETLRNDDSTGLQSPMPQSCSFLLLSSLISSSPNSPSPLLSPHPQCKCHIHALNTTFPSSPFLFSISTTSAPAKGPPARSAPRNAAASKLSCIAMRSRNCRARASLSAIDALPHRGGVG